MEKKDDGDGQEVVKGREKEILGRVHIHGPGSNQAKGCDFCSVAFRAFAQAGKRSLVQKPEEGAVFFNASMLLACRTGRVASGRLDVR